MNDPTDNLFMRQALLLAERGRPTASPNPAVGALVVRDGVVVGSGFHERAGADHAEIVALRLAGEDAQGSTLYLTLAPCTREGRTPACLPAVVASGVARVVYALPDPHPDEARGCAAALREAGIDVLEGVLSQDAAALIENFTTWARTGRPFVTVKMATTLDGRAAAADGSSRWITGPEARADAHRLRAWADAVMVGVGTIVADDPSLTVRDAKGPDPLRIVIDPSARIPLGSRVLSDGGETLVVVTEKAPERALEALGTRALVVPITDGRLDLDHLLDALGARGVTDLLCEGGPTLAGEMLDRGLADKMVWYIAPALLGPDGIAGVAGLVAPSIGAARRFRFSEARMVGSDVRLVAVPKG